MSRFAQCLLLLAMATNVLSSAPGAASDDTQASFELTGGSSSVSYSEHAAWGWWNVDKYDDWQTSSSGGFGLIGGRLMFSGTTYAIFVAAERSPTLEVTGTRSEPGGGLTGHDLTTDIEVYDVAIGQWFGNNPRTGIMPWGGVTYMSIDETRTAIEGGGVSYNRTADRAKSRLLGLGLGADGRVEVTRHLSATGRLALRWARGSREASLNPTDPDLDEIEVSDTTSRAMYGVELGLRWLLVPGAALEGGLWYRNWRHDRGPASYSGPYLRLLVAF